MATTLSSKRIANDFFNSLLKLLYSGWIRPEDYLNQMQYFESRYKIFQQADSVETCTAESHQKVKDTFEALVDKVEALRQQSEN